MFFSDDESRSFNVRVGGQGSDWVLLHLAGDIDIASCGDLELLLDAHLRLGRILLIDMSGVTFLDCAGLRAVARDGWRGGQVRLVDVSRAVRRLLELIDVRYPRCGIPEDRPRKVEPTRNPAETSDADQWEV